MTKPNSHNQKKSARKWLLITVIGILGLMGFARLALMTAPVHQWVKDKIIATANNQLRPTLSIGRLSGDLWSGATLTDVTLNDGKMVASVDTVHLEYNMLSYFSDVFQIQEIRLVRPFIKLQQRADSTWNVQSWAAPTQDTTQSAFAFSLSNLRVDRGRIDVQTIQLPQDSTFFIDDMQLESTLAYYGDSFDGRIGELSFKIKDTNLAAPISVLTAAAADEASITLEKLAIATGQSMFTASGQANIVDSTARFEARATPLGWRDLAAYARDVPIKEDVRASFSLKGDLRNFTATLNVDADGIDQLTLQGDFRQVDQLNLTSLRTSANQLNLAAFLSDTAMPQLRDLHLEAHGLMPLDNYQQGYMEGTFSARDLQAGQYQLDAVEGTFALRNKQARLHLEPVKGEERLMASATVNDIWDQSPSLVVQVRGNSINPARWLQNERYAGDLTFSGEAAGRGWAPAQNYWTYRLDIDQSMLLEQRVDSATLHGRFNQSNLTNQSQINIGPGQYTLDAGASDLQAVPQFSYKLNIRNADLSNFIGMEKYPSVINGLIEGHGCGTSLNNLELQASVAVDSSTFKGEMIKRFELYVGLADSVLQIENGRLRSTIADAGFSGNIDVTDLYAADNTLNVNMQIQDISSFSAALDVDILQASGSINGALKPMAQDSLIFAGEVDLSDVNYNQQFIARKITGDLRVQLEQEPAYLMNVDIVRPILSAVEMQNIKFKTEGRLSKQAAEGSFELDFFGPREGSITQQGTYRVADDTSAVELTSFNLTSSLRTLSLTQPFHARFAGGALQTDTMRVSSADQSAFMEMAVPYADSHHQKGYLKGKNLNLAVIQEAALNNVYLEGLLFGEISVDRTDTSMTASGDIVMSDLVYQEAELDTLQFQANIANERLAGSMELHQQGELIAEGAVDIPFKAENPGQLEDDFFEQSVSGHLRMHKLSLERFSRILEQLGYHNTRGTVQFDGTLEGRAGNPTFDATLSLTDAQLSGVPVDSLIASANYRHDAADLNLKASLTSLRQKALEVDAQMPLNVDLQSLDVALPGPQDSISVDMQTNDFNLKALNDFVNRDKIRNLEGRINGNVKIRGPRSDLKASGEFTLRRGAVRVVPANVRLDHIKSTIQFQPGRIMLADLHMESGKGELDASGELALEQLIPGKIDVTVKARNFKAANTDEYNGLVNLDLKVSGSASQPNVTGNLEMINGFVELDNFGEKSVETIELDNTRAMEPNISLYDSLRLDMNIEFNRRFFVRNERYLEMEIELDGGLDIIKEPAEDLQLFGTLRTTKGYAKPLGKRFEVEEGSLAFSGPPDNPQLNIRSLYEPPQAEQEVKIWYVIEGTVEDPQFRYESQPQMNLGGIISYTLFGQPYYKLNPTEQSVASLSSNNAAADFAMEVLLERVESIATKQLGIDMVRIETSRFGGESGTSITTGWYINPKVFFAIQNIITGSTPTTGFYLEYYLRENLKLILSQGNDNRQGVDVEWEYDY